MKCEFPSYFATIVCSMFVRRTGMCPRIIRMTYVLFRAIDFYLWMDKKNRKKTTGCLKLHVLVSILESKFFRKQKFTLSTRRITAGAVGQVWVLWLASRSRWAGARPVFVSAHFCSLGERSIVFHMRLIPFVHLNAAWPYRCYRAVFVLLVLLCTRPWPQDKRFVFEHQLLRCTHSYSLDYTCKGCINACKCVQVGCSSVIITVVL